MKTKRSKNKKKHKKNKSNVEYERNNMRQKNQPAAVAEEFG